MMARQMAKGPAEGQRVSPGKGGLQRGQPLEEETRALLQLQWQQEAIPVHLLPPGWPAVTAGARLLSVPPGVGEGSPCRLDQRGQGGPAKLFCLCSSGWQHGLQATPQRGGPLKQLCAELIWVVVAGQVISGNPYFLPRLLFWQMMSRKLNSAGDPREVGAGLASIPQSEPGRFLLEDGPGCEF